MDLGELLKQWRVEKAEGSLSQIKDSFYTEARTLANSPDPYEAKKAREVYEDILRMRQRKMLMAALTQLRGGEVPDGLVEIEKKAYRRIYSVLDGMRDGVVYDDDVEIEDESGMLLSTQESETVPKGQETLIEEEVIETPEKEVEELSVEEEKPQEPAEELKVEKPPEEAISDEIENELRAVKFVRAVPSFIAPDLSSVGPFEDGEEVELDPDVAAILIANGVAIDPEIESGEGESIED